jgi:hypothetical protein
VAVLVVLALAASSGRARAGDPFEIQVYDGTANPPGAPGLEVHLNDWATGHRDAELPQRPLHGQFHLTFEPSFGVTRSWELGAYLQLADRSDDGQVDWAGVKLRSKFVTPPGWRGHWRLGLNFELAYLPATYDADRWGSEVRPIVAWESDDWLFAVNPIVDQSLAGPGASQGPWLEPAVKAARAVGPVALGLEYYGTLGPIASPLPLREQEHYIFETLDLVGLEQCELDVGVGEGLTPASAGVVVKVIVGYTFDSLTTRPPLRASNERRQTR